MRLSLTIIQFTAHVMLIMYTQQQQAHIHKPHKKLCGDGRAAKQQVRKLEAVVADLHTGGLVLYGHFSQEGSSMGN